MTAEMPNLRAAFRWAADHGDLDTAAAIAHYAAFVGFWGEQHEPSGGPRNSSNPRAPSSTESWPSSTLRRRCATRPEGSKMPLL